MARTKQSDNVDDAAAAVSVSVPSFLEPSAHPPVPGFRVPRSPTFPSTLPLHHKKNLMKRSRRFATLVYQDTLLS